MEAGKRPKHLSPISLKLAEFVVSHSISFIWNCGGGVPPLAEGCREPSRDKLRLGPSGFLPTRLRAPLAIPSKPFDHPDFISSGHSS